MRTLVRAARAIGRVLWRSKQLDADMREEMRFHVQQEAERLTRVEGLDPVEARRQAYVRFGGLEKYKEEGREARGLHWLDGVSLDARLGLRMLVKHRWLTLVGGFAMTVAIAIGAITFEVVSDLLNPALPFPDGQRVVAVKYVATKAGRADDRVLYAFSASSGETSYGLGWELEKHPLAGQPTRMAGHGSKGEFIGGTTYLMTFPERGLVVAVMANISFADTKSIALNIAQTFAAQGRNPARQ
jgi:hypothetical protein